MHSNGIAHWDLKPANIFITEEGQLKLGDLATAYISERASKNFGIRQSSWKSEDTNDSNEERKWDTFVGTQDYVSPEVLKSLGASMPADIWSLGVIIYQLIGGKCPFTCTNEYDVFQKIIKVEFDFPDDFPPNARDLISKMLLIDEDRRLGAGSE